MFIIIVVIVVDGQETEGFTDNFTPSADVLDSSTPLVTTSACTAPGMNSASLLLDSAPNTSDNSRSSINDLIGLDLSPNGLAASQPVQTNPNLWSTSQPNYYVAGNHMSGRVSSIVTTANTNPFNSAYVPSSRLPSSNSSPSLTAMVTTTSNGQVTTRKGPPVRPPPPMLAPTRAKDETQKSSDPLADLKW